MPKETFCLLNDSFPPFVDGVANAVINYATEIKRHDKSPLVITPSHPDANDRNFDFDIIRYKSLRFLKFKGYYTGVPFSSKTLRFAKSNNISLIHSHCPLVSTFLAREIRKVTKSPIIMTYHSKFDIEIESLTKSHFIRATAQKVLLNNISACDEVWVVSDGAGKSLRNLGYSGKYIVMPNGVDFTHARLPRSVVVSTTAGYDLPNGIPLYLFVGRMLWYKGIRIILDALAKLKSMNKDFRMIFIGDGNERQEIKKYSKKCKVFDKCLFLGSITNREALKAWYCRADLLLFPSTYDTNGLVVREAAACDVAAVLISKSAAAEGITHNRNGFLIDENAESLYTCLSELYGRPETTKRVGKNAGDQVYFSWENAVSSAMDRYETVIEKHRKQNYQIARPI